MDGAKVKINSDWNVMMLERVSLYIDVNVIQPSINLWHSIIIFWVFVILFALINSKNIKLYLIKY